jgi:hypothetical protein
MSMGGSSMLHHQQQQKQQLVQEYKSAERKRILLVNYENDVDYILLKAKKHDSIKCGAQSQSQL